MVMDRIKDDRRRAASIDQPYQHSLLFQCQQKTLLVLNGVGLYLFTLIYLSSSGESASL